MCMECANMEGISYEEWLRKSGVLMGSIPKNKPVKVKPFKPPVDKSRKLFIKLGLHPDRNLGSAVADFYLLESMIGTKVKDGFSGDMYTGDGMAITLFEKVCRELSDEFAIYLDMAVGGELRHCWDHNNPAKHSAVPAGIEKYKEAMADFSGGEDQRREGWRKWMALRRSAPKKTLVWVKWASEIFVADEWREGGTGGEGWSTVAKVTYEYLCGNMKRRTFIDRAFTLQHNNGYVFDKTYNSLGDLDEALKEQAAGNYRALARRATPFIASRWASFDRRNRVWTPPGEAS